MKWNCQVCPEHDIEGNSCPACGSGKEISIIDYVSLFDGYAISFDIDGFLKILGSKKIGSVFVNKFSSEQKSQIETNISKFKKIKIEYEEFLLKERSGDFDSAETILDSLISKLSNKEATNFLKNKKNEISKRKIKIRMSIRQNRLKLFYLSIFLIIVFLLVMAVISEVREKNKEKTAIRLYKEGKVKEAVLIYKDLYDQTGNEDYKTKGREFLYHGKLKHKNTKNFKVEHKLQQKNDKNNKLSNVVTSVIELKSNKNHNKGKQQIKESNESTKKNMKVLTLNGHISPKLLKNNVEENSEKENRVIEFDSIKENTVNILKLKDGLSKEYFKELKNFTIISKSIKIPGDISIGFIVNKDGRIGIRKMYLYSSSDVTEEMKKKFKKILNEKTKKIVLEVPVDKMGRNVNVIFKIHYKVSYIKGVIILSR